MPKRKPGVVRIVYRGDVDEYIIPAPSGAVYTFLRNVPVEVSAVDAPFFLVEPKRSLYFVEPVEPEPVIALPEPAVGSFEVAPEPETVEPVESP